METAISSEVKLKRIGEFLIRFSLVVILIWIGLLKFTHYEAAGIQPLVENSGLMSWGYSVMSVDGFAKLIGIIEIILGLLIASRAFLPKLSAKGSIGAIIMSIITLTFLITTPPVWQEGFGFPFLSPMPGQFLLKDLLLLAASVWIAGEALIAANAMKNRI